MRSRGSGCATARRTVPTTSPSAFRRSPRARCTATRDAPIGATECRPGMVLSAVMSPSSPAYRLVRPAVEPVRPPALDESQQAVVDHPGGPLLVLAGPGTGKTTTLVEAGVGPGGGGAPPPEGVLLAVCRQGPRGAPGRVA